MSFVNPQPCVTEVDEDGQCCPNTFIGFCLADETPISITMQGGAQLGWTNLLTGVFTPGPPPLGTVVCSAGTVNVGIDCLTHSITVCQNEVPWVSDYSYPEDTPHVSGDAGAFVLAVRNDSGLPLAADGDYIPFTTDATGALRVNATFSGEVTVSLDCATDSVTICPGDDPIDVVGTVTVDQGTSPWITSLDATTLAALETITVLQGTSPWVVSGTVELGAATLAALETITVLQGTSPWVIGDGGGSITVDAVDLDIRDLVFATDKVDVTGSTVALDAGTLAALETITVLQGTSPWVIGDGGGSITVDAVDLDIRNLVFATDKVDVSGSVVALDAGTLAALETITVLQGTSPWVIGDGGGSITVDGSVTVSGTVTTNYERAEDSPHTSTNIGAFVLAVRNDAGTPLAADQDYIPFTTDATGALRVNAGTTVTQTGRDDTDNQAPVATGLLTSVSRNYVFDGTNWDRWTGAVTQGTSPWVIGDGGGSITVDGTVTVTQGTSPWVTSLDAASLAALESITVQNGAGAAAVNIQDGGNSITVDGTVTASFNGGSLSNGAETAVAAAAVQVLAANAGRKKLIVQNTGPANVRIGVTGVTATTGVRLIPSGTLVFDMPDCPTNAIFAIREGATSSTVNATEVT